MTEVTEPDTKSPFTGLLKITDEIAWGVSADDITQTIPYLKKNPEEILALAANRINNCVESDLNAYLKKSDFQKKLEQLQEEDVPKDKACWLFLRDPVTIKTEINTIKARCLKKRIEELQKRLDPLQKENEALCNDLKKKGELYRRQCKNVDNFSSK